MYRKGGHHYVVSPYATVFDDGHYREHEHKTKNYTKEKWAEVNDGLMAIFTEFATCKANGATPDSAEAQALVTKLQNYITENYKLDSRQGVAIEYLPSAG